MTRGDTSVAGRGAWRAPTPTELRLEARVVELEQALDDLMDAFSELTAWAQRAVDAAEKRAGPCPASYSGACTCDRGGGHPGKCHCGHCGRYFVGSIGGDP